MAGVERREKRNRWLNMITCSLCTSSVRTFLVRTFLVVDKDVYNHSSDTQQATRASFSSVLEHHVSKKPRIVTTVEFHIGSGSLREPPQDQTLQGLGGVNKPWYTSKSLTFYICAILYDIAALRLHTRTVSNHTNIMPTNCRDFKSCIRKEES